MFEIIKKERHGNYVLRDEKNEKQSSLIIQFFGVEPKVGNKLILNEKLFNKKFVGYSQPYFFEAIKWDEKLFEEMQKDVDLAVLVCGDEKTLLKRIYG